MMKRLLFVIALFLLACTVNAQEATSFEDILNTYSQNLTAKGLAGKILKDFSSDEERAKAAFYWVSHHVKYNLSAYKEAKNKVIGFRYRNEEEKIKKLEAIKDSIVRQTLTTKKAVCEGYAQTLAKVYTHLGFENEVIRGYVRNSIYDIGNEQFVPNHAWNVVKIHKKWIVVDATWAAGSVINGRWQQIYDDYYFNIPIKHYLKTHYPADEKWMFDIELTKKEFYEQPIFTPEFLKTNLELIAPLHGTLHIEKDKPLTLKIKNLLTFQRVLYGVSNNRFAKQPDISYEDGIGYIQIKSLKNSDKLFLVIDGEIYIEFKLI
ncbi:transglutaminase domain-containing protein [Tenacibaculum sp. TC6]|uniref:transglutaminase domain-containing protein n=1 Tax=Tenacibaculum sp. TC6 TaxID=3423223 RepID=UPI003D36498A